MKTTTGLSLPLFLGAIWSLIPPSIAEEKPRKLPGAVPDNYETRSGVDGWLFSSSIPTAEIKRTGPKVGPREVKPEGIGVLAAGQKALEAFNALDLPGKENWRLHSVKRKEYSRTGWVYEAAFTLKSEPQPEGLSNQLQITVLLDGTVIPVEIRKNGR